MRLRALLPRTLAREGAMRRVRLPALRQQLRDLLRAGSRVLRTHVLRRGGPLLLGGRVLYRAGPPDLWGGELPDRQGVLRLRGELGGLLWPGGGLHRALRLRRRGGDLLRRGRPRLPGSDGLRRRMRLLPQGDELLPRRHLRRLLPRSHGLPSGEHLLLR